MYIYERRSRCPTTLAMRSTELYTINSTGVCVLKKRNPSDKSVYKTQKIYSIYINDLRFFPPFHRTFSQNKSLFCLMRILCDGFLEVSSGLCRVEC